jgi:hypothetical protein
MLEQQAARPTPEELSARIAARGHAGMSEPSEAAVRRLRDVGE